MTLSLGSVTRSVPQATTASTVTKVRQGYAGHCWKLTSPQDFASQNDTKEFPESPESPSPLQMINGWPVETSGDTGAAIPRSL